MSKAFPYLEVKGTHTDLGHAIGEKFRDRINWWVDRLHADPHYQDKLSCYPQYLTPTQEHFPNLVEEVRAIASAAHVDFADMFILNTVELEQIYPERCTSVVSFGNPTVIGHNEDALDYMKDDLYVLKATIGDTAFLGLNYAGEIPGTSVAMNNWAVVQCVNTLHQKTSQIGVPRYFLARAILECHSLEEAEDVVTKTSKASGLNHFLVQGENVKNIEIAGNQHRVTDKTNVCFFHTNHYLDPSLVQFESDRSKSSVIRYQKALDKLTDGMSESEILALLSSADQKHILDSGFVTHCSILLFPQKGEMKIYDSSLNAVATHTLR